MISAVQYLPPESEDNFAMANWSKYREKAEKANLLVVGAGGIGCELIKNLVLAGFVNLVVVRIFASLPRAR